LHVAIEEYIASPNAAALREALSNVVHEHQELYSDYKKRLIDIITESYPPQEDLVHKVVEITLQYRLGMFQSEYYGIQVISVPLT
jgi:hypothetical protein